MIQVVRYACVGMHHFILYTWLFPVTLQIQLISRTRSCVAKADDAELARPDLVDGLNRMSSLFLFLNQTIVVGSYLLVSIYVQIFIIQLVAR